ncbi:MAG: peptide deformylase [Kiritimatiellia bacterium]
MDLKLKTYGEPVLREPALPVEKITPEIRELAEEMLRVMHHQNGVGLAAEQVGRREAVFVVDIPPDADRDEDQNPLNPDVKMPQVFINPEITESSKKKASCEEGCLSFPGLYAEVSRPAEVTVRYTDMDGQTRDLHCRGLLARAVQHESDHLHGTLFIDRISYARKIALKGRLRKLQEETLESNLM